MDVSQVIEITEGIVEIMRTIEVVRNPGRAAFPRKILSPNKTRLSTVVAYRPQ